MVNIVCFSVLLCCQWPHVCDWSHAAGTISFLWKCAWTQAQWSQIMEGILSMLNMLHSQRFTDVFPIDLKGDAAVTVPLESRPVTLWVECPALYIYSYYRAGLDVMSLIVPCGAPVWKLQVHCSFSTHLFRFILWHVTCLYVWEAGHFPCLVYVEHDGQLVWFKTNLQI